MTEKNLNESYDQLCRFGVSQLCQAQVDPDFHGKTGIEWHLFDPEPKYGETMIRLNQFIFTTASTNYPWSKIGAHFLVAIVHEKWIPSLVEFAQKNELEFWFARYQATTYEHSRRYPTSRKKARMLIACYPEIQFQAGVEEEQYESTSLDPFKLAVLNDRSKLIGSVNDDSHQMTHDDLSRKMEEAIIVNRQELRQLDREEQFQQIYFPKERSRVVLWELFRMNERHQWEQESKEKRFIPHQPVSLDFQNLPDEFRLNEALKEQLFCCQLLDELNPTRKTLYDDLLQLFMNKTSKRSSSSP